MPTLAREAGRAAGVVVVASVVVFLLTRALPRTPMQAYLERRGLPVTDEAVQALREAWGLTGPLHRQYLHWVGDVVRGDLGTSLFTDADIGASLAARLPLSAGIGLGGLLVAWCLAWPLGMLAATRGRGWALLTRTLAVLAQGVPAFVVAVALVNLLGVTWRLVPFYDLTGAAQLVAPALLVALYATGQLARVVTAHATALRAEPFVAAELARGFSVDTVLWRHGRRQVWHGLLAVSLARLPAVIGGAAVLEYVFAVPGMSSWVIGAVQDRDLTVVQAYLLLMVAWMAVSRLALQGVLVWLDPRTR